MLMPPSGSTSFNSGAGALTTIGSAPQTLPTMLLMIIATASVVMIQAVPPALRRSTGATATRSSSKASSATTATAAAKAATQGQCSCVISSALAIEPTITRSPWAKLKTLVGRYRMLNPTATRQYRLPAVRPETITSSHIQRAALSGPFAEHVHRARVLAREQRGHHHLVAGQRAMVLRAEADAADHAGVILRRVEGLLDAL